MKYKKNFIGWIVDRWLGESATRRPVDIYSKVPKLSRQNYYGAVSDDRVVSPLKWSGFRKAMNIDREEFWTLLKNFYDPI